MSNSNLIFQKWKASLRSKDRSKKAMPGNFDELFEELRQSGASFEEAHAILPQAIKAHYPARAVAKNTYAKYSHIPGFAASSEKEFIDEWFKSIDDAGTESFYAFFSIESEEDTEPKLYGNMSAREYSLQRKYADSFPRITNEMLAEKSRNLMQQYNLDEAALLNILGNDDDNSE